MRAAGPAAVTVRVPAKVNLHLSVGSRREDGFHDIATVFQAVSLYDEVTVEPARSLSVHVTGEGAADVPTGTDNLAARAAEALAALADRRPHVRITIHKGIPVAGGMAGGSADAAATLLACGTLWRTELERDVLHAVATSLGSDVPFALHGGTALGTGRGERLTPVLGTGRYHWVFVLADAGLSTPAVYGELDRLRGEDEARAAAPPDELLTALRAGDAVAVGAHLSNDLEAAALRLRPRLRQVLDAGWDQGVLGAVVSGSGPTVAMLVDSEEHGVEVAASLTGTGLCRAVRRAYGPVAGARVVPPGEGRA